MMRLVQRWRGLCHTLVVLAGCGPWFLCVAEEAPPPDPALKEFYNRQELGAQRGHPRDQFLLGVRYLKGEGVSQDSKLALSWIRSAVTNQNTEFPLSPTYRKEAEDVLAALEGRGRAPKPPDVATNDLSVSGTRTTLSFTDRTGHRYKDIEVVIVEPNSIVYLEPDRIHAGQVRFADMPAALRERFGYDPAEALKYEQGLEQQTRLAAQRAVIEQQLQDARSAGDRPADDSRAGVPSIRTGTGFFVTDDGYLVTCFHVVKGAMNVGIKAGQIVLPAQLMATDMGNDIALLKVPGTFSALALTSSNSAALGDSVFTVGYPNVTLQGFEPKLTKGEISGLAGLRDDPRLFQVSVPAQPGNSGGALVDSRGNVVGLLTMRLSDAVALQTSGALPQNVNYALKNDSLAGFLNGIPDVASRLRPPSRDRDRKYEDIVKQVQNASVLVIAGP